MRALLHTSLLGLVSGFYLSMDEACMFVGARFVRQDSTCVESACTEFARLATGELTVRTVNATAVSCAEAVELVQDFLSETATPARRSKRMQRDTGNAPGLKRMLTDDVIPELMRLAFGADTGAERLYARLREFDEQTRLLAATHPRHWFEVTVPALLASHELGEVARLVGDIAKGSWHIPLTYVTLRNSQQAALHFYFDVAALLGRHFVPRHVVERSSLMLRPSIPRFRLVHRLEVYSRPPWEGVPPDAQTAVRAMGALVRLGETDATLTLTDTKTVYALLRGWPVSIT